MNQSQLVANFLASAEFAAKFGNPSNERFVLLLYENILLRQPSPQELNNRAGVLYAGTQHAAAGGAMITRAPLTARTIAGAIQRKRQKLYETEKALTGETNPQELELLWRVRGEIAAYTEVLDAIRLRSTYELEH